MFKRSREDGHLSKEEVLAQKSPKFKQHNSNVSKVPPDLSLLISILCYYLLITYVYARLKWGSQEQLLILSQIEEWLLHSALQRRSNLRSIFKH